jgi:hypothetical protein
MAADEEAEALAQLRNMKQGQQQSMADFSAKFQEVASRTNLEDNRLKTMFLERVTQNMKVLFAMSQALASEETKAKTFPEVVARCLKLDVGVNDPVLGIGRGRTSGSSQSVAVPVAPAADPNAMEVDASRTGAPTKQDFRAAMGNHCFGCGTPGHRFNAEGCRAKGATCRYCQRRGHFEVVCKDKFCKRPRGQDN